MTYSEGYIKLEIRSEHKESLYVNIAQNDTITKFRYL